MKIKIITGSALLVLLILVAGGLILKSKVGDVRPALLPPQDSNSNSPSVGSGETVRFLKVAPEYKITYFTKSAPGARDLEWSPDGTLLVSEPSQGKVVALPDKNEDGVADSEKAILTNLRGPHGIAFREGKMFVAEEDKVVRYGWDEGSLTARLEKKLFDLPADGGHNTRSLIFTSDGKLLISVGSSCNVCVENDPRRASIMVSDSEGNNLRVLAKGLRNSVFMALNPKSKDVWATEMGRDLLGDNIPPEEINVIEAGPSPSSGRAPLDYGWPYCFDNKKHDDNFDPQKDHSCRNTIAPVFEFQAHSAPLGLTFIDSPLFPDSWQGDLLVSYHGSWNRSVPTGYKVVHMKVSGNTVTSAEDFITGFLSGSTAQARPVDVIFSRNGNLYLSDDKAGAVYLLSKN